MRRIPCLGPVAAITLACGVSAVAQEYSFRRYGSAEGFQNLVVLSLAQDPAGYIWAGTEGGLYRYNGIRFRLMGQAEGLPCSTEVHGLFVASDGALWANTCAKIFRFDGQRFSEIPGVNKLLRGTQVMADAPGGSVLIATSAGIYQASRRADGSFSTQSYPLPAALATKPTHGILRQGSRLWFGCGQQLCMDDAGKVSVFGKEHGLPEDTWDGIRIAPDGSVWVRSARSLYRGPPAESRFLQEKFEIASSGFWGALSLCRDGTVMVPTDRGLAININGTWNIVNRARGLSNETTVTALEDHEGSLWIGLAGGGLVRWVGRGIWENWKADQVLPSDIVWNIRRDRKGALWVGTAFGLTRIDTSRHIRTWTKRDGLSGDNVRWLAETSDGSIWVAMKPGGLARIDPVSGKVHQVGPGQGLLCDPEDVFVDRRDRLWLPTRCGLFLNESPSASERIVAVETPESFGRSAWKVMEDTQGTIWVTNHTGLWSLRNGQWRPHGRAEGLLTDSPYILVAAPDGGLWLRHRFDAGIDRLEVSGDRIVRSTSVVSADPKTAAVTAFHGVDAFGNLWRGSTNGVSVLHGNTWSTFTTEDGLVSNDCDGEAFWADRDGSVWLGTSGGLAHYRTQTGGLPGPPLALPTITQLEIDQPSRLVRAEFSSLNFKFEQSVRFAYRLDQALWTESTARNVTISGLAAGSHRLEVRCRVRDGPFLPAIGAAEFRLQPTWKETWWARLLAFISGVAAILLFVRWRLDEAVRKQAQLEATVIARTAKLCEANRLLDDKASQLRTSEGRLKNAERLAHLGHWDWDVRINHLSWSEEMFRIFGIPRNQEPTYEEFVQATVYEDRERLVRWMKQCLAKKTGCSIEFRIGRPDGDLRVVSCNSEVSLDEESRPMRLFGACQDVTDARRAQHEDFARKKLESIGMLAGGIAHDFNNLLAGVLAQADLALEQTASGADPKEELTAIRNVAIRGSEVVRQLLMYAGKESEVSELVDVSCVVVEMLELLKVSISKRVTLVTELARDLPLVRASAAQIRQIVMNLVTNASEAIGDRDGMVRVSTGRVTPDCVTPLSRKLADGHYLHLDVSDTGRGMSQDAQANIFDPFFSTKGAGHGLGLAVVYGNVRALGGAIQVASKLNHGTTFHVLLPCTESVPESAPAPVPKPGEPIELGRELTVLVVEDEDPLREAVVRMLRKTGFTALEAADGTSAIDFLRANTSGVDLMLLDMTIAGASSRDLIAEATRVHPNVRVILTSAYSPEMLTSATSTSQVYGFIRKPYQFHDVLQILQQAITS